MSGNLELLCRGYIEKEGYGSAARVYSAMARSLNCQFCFVSQNHCQKNAKYRLAAGAAPRTLLV